MKAPVQQLRALLLLSIVAVTPAILRAHHAFAAEFNSRSPISLTGKITKVAWLNPHAHFTVQVKNERGQQSLWDVEIASPNVLARQGWTRYSLKSGDLVTVSGFRARDGSNLASARSVRFPDGHTAYLGSAGDGGPDQ